jgi:acetyltransferase-like isoleucine patch superfamily enzyme
MNSHSLTGIKRGSNCHIIATTLKLGKNISFGNNVILVGDEIEIGDNVKIGSQVDLRASRIFIGNDSEIGHNAGILVAEEFRIGTASRLSDHTNILCRVFIAGNFLYTANNFTVGYGGTTESTARVHIGNRVALGPHNILNANCEINLADKVGSGSYVTLWTHGFHFGHSILEGYKATFLPITINSNVWLGYHVTVLPGVTIGENSIIAAGAVVASSLPADYLIGGVPAKPLKKLEKKTLSTAEAYLAIEDLIKKWAEELIFKNLEVIFEPSSAQPFPCMLKVRSNGDEDFTAVYLLPAKMNSIDRQEEKAIFVSVDGPSSIGSGLSAGQTLFLLHTMELQGATSAISEDLRDFLRRHTLPCGFDKCYRSIEPFAFTRLKEIKPDDCIQ